MGKYLCSALLFAASLVSAQQAHYYTVNIKSVSSVAALPVAEFTLEVGGSQIKGFEAEIDAAGFSGEGFKPPKVVERETKKYYTELIEKELARPPEDKVAEMLDFLENKARRLEMFLDDPEEQPANGRAARNRPATPPAPTPPVSAEQARKNKAREAQRKRYEAEAAMREYLEFKTAVDKTRGNATLLKPIVDKIDKSMKDRLTAKMLRESVHKGGYKLGTYASVNLNKADAKTVTIDFEYAASYIMGWQLIDGNNNDNSINSVLEMEMVELDEVKDLVLEFGRPYCFQLSRPIKQDGSLEDAKNATKIFSDKKGGSGGIEIPAGDQTNASPLNANGPLAEIQKEFKGKEKEVVRVIVTVTK